MFEILIDTSNTELNVGLAKDKVLIDKISYEAWQRQSELLVVEVNNLLEKHNVELVLALVLTQVFVLA